MTRQNLVDKIADTQQAINRTKSPMCRRDLTKHLHRMQRELRDYDAFQKQAKSRGVTAPT